MSNYEDRNEDRDNRDDRYDDRKAKAKRIKYSIWWSPRPGVRREFGPLFDRKVAQRDVAELKNRHGPNNAGYEVYNPYIPGEQRGGYRRRR